MRAKKRADQLLVEQGLAESRAQAQRLILAGSVRLSGARTGVKVEKAGQSLPTDSVLEVTARPQFVSRAGQKLAGALEHFGLEVRGLTCMDIGASTGGFTDCLLQGGAERVYCFDVGTNQLAWKIRSHERVRAREQFNCRNLSRAEFPEGESIDLGVVDVSFISLTLILGPMLGVLRPGGQILALIKPQFELARAEVGKGGVVRSVQLREQAVEKVCAFVKAKGAHVLAVVPSTLAGTDGNQEFIAWMKKPELHA